jgi:malate synthase
MTLTLPPGVAINAPILPGFETILTEPALALVAKLHRAFEPRRQELLAARAVLAERIDAGERPDFLAETKAIRDGDWRIAPVPAALQCRRVEITGPVDAKMVINAFNSGADSYMTDFEDSNSPLWTNQIEGQINIGRAIRRNLSFTQESPAGSKSYKLNDKIATLQVRPRGWHLDEKHVTVDGQRVAGGIFDFALFMFHNAKEQLARGAGPYFYLPKIESHLEARLWNEIFVVTQKELGLPQGTIKATVLIETIIAAFEMDEILYELREHSAGLNAGRWDYIFSCIKKFKLDRDFCLADRAKVTMTAPVHALLCAAAAQDLPQARRAGDRRHERADPDQERPGEERDRDGRDHRRQAARRHRRLRRRLGRAPGAGRGVDEGVRRRARRPAEPVREAEARGLGQGRRPARLQARDADHRGGLRMNINVGIHYLGAWLAGNGCVPIHNLMEDAATAEISRSQVWQWIRSPKGVLDDGRKVTAELVKQLVPRSWRRSRPAASSASSTGPRRSSPR